MTGAVFPNARNATEGVPYQHPEPSTLKTTHERGHEEPSVPINATPACDGQNGLTAGDAQAIEKLGAARQKILEQLSRVIVGQHEVIEELLISLFSRGHCLLEGVPGLAKTLMISTLARTLNLTFSRIQFTPDLMPADITGTEIIEENNPRGAAIIVSSKAPCSRT